MIGALMIGRWLLGAALLALPACEQVQSDHPLLIADGPPPATGLWALLEEGCSAPADEAVQTWPGCATPVWVQPGEATVIVHSPVRSRFVAASGEPRVLQVAGDNDGGQPRYSYYAFKPQDAPPHRSALVWAIYCDPPAAERSRPLAREEEDDTECLIDDVAELRRLSRLAVEDEPIRRAVHIGPG